MKMIEERKNVKILIISNRRCQNISSEKGLSVPSDVGRITKNQSFTFKSSSDDFPQAVCKGVLISSYECEK